MINYNSLNHPLINNFFTEWLEDLNESFYIIIETLLDFFI